MATVAVVVARSRNLFGVVVLGGAYSFLTATVMVAMDAVDVPTRLKRYALARWQRVARVQARSIRNGQIFHSTGLVRFGRDASIRLLGERILDVPWLYAG